MILIVTFGRTNESQLHIAMGFLVIVLYIQERGRPYYEKQQPTSKKDKRKNKTLHFMEIGKYNCDSIFFLRYVIRIAVEDWTNNSSFNFYT